MQRTDITSIFPEATREQQDALMKLYGDGVNAAKGDSAALAQQLKDAQAALAAAQNAGGANELEKANKRLADLEKELTTMKAADAVRQLREKVAADKNIPVSLLTGDTEETCAAQADAILAFAGNTGSLSVGDKGEAGGGAADARAQFTAWAKDNI